MQRKASAEKKPALPLQRSTSPASTSAGVRPLGRHGTPSDAPRSTSQPSTGTAAPGPSAGPAQLRGPIPSGVSQTRGKLSAQLQARLTQPQIAPGQPGVGSRNKEKLITLPDGSTQEPTPSDQLFQDLEPPEQVKEGRITVVCVADGFDRKRLEKKLQVMGRQWFVAGYTDALYGQYCPPGSDGKGDVFYFDYGVVAFWGCTKAAEQDVLRTVVADCTIQPLTRANVEVDELQFRHVSTDKPNIQNDTVTISFRLASDHKTKLAICFAISQSTKLSVYEERILEVVEATKDIPQELADQGVVRLSGKTITKLIGEVFIQKSEVNLLSTVLDTPEFFWGETDRLEALYDSVVEYLEFDERVEVLNQRFRVLQEMLELARVQHNVAHTAHLDWIVIWLILIDIVTLFMQLAGMIWWGEH